MFFFNTIFLYFAVAHSFPCAGFLSCCSKAGPHPNQKCVAAGLFATGTQNAFGWLKLMLGLRKGTILRGKKAETWIRGWKLVQSCEVHAAADQWIWRHDAAKNPEIDVDESKIESSIYFDACTQMQRQQSFEGVWNTYGCLHLRAELLLCWDMNSKMWICGGCLFGWDGSENPQIKIFKTMNLDGSCKGHILVAARKWIARMNPAEDPERGEKLKHSPKDIKEFVRYKDTETWMERRCVCGGSWDTWGIDPWMQILHKTQTYVLKTMFLQFAAAPCIWPDHQKKCAKKNTNIFVLHTIHFKKTKQTSSKNQFFEFF